MVQIPVWTNQVQIEWMNTGMSLSGFYQHIMTVLQAEWMNEYRNEPPCA